MSSKYCSVCLNAIDENKRGEEMLMFYIPIGITQIFWVHLTCYNKIDPTKAN